MTVTLKIEKVDRNLVRKAKMVATARGLNLRSFILEAIEKALPEDIDQRIAAFEGGRKGERR